MHNSVNSRTTRGFVASSLWGVVLVLVIAFLFVPRTNAIFRRLSSELPYVMGFFKFLLLSSMGELLALRIRSGRWSLPPGFPLRMIVWGVIGLLITFMFSFYYTAVIYLQDTGMLPGSPGGFLTALETSVIMNLTFGPAFMIAHRISDSAIELLSASFAGKSAGGRRGERPRLYRAVLANIEWAPFVRIISLSLLFFWIPVHTFVFLLPVVYRIIAAAMLSIVLGVILALAAAGRRGAGKNAMQSEGGRG